MADHVVRFTVPRRELGKADVRFYVRRNGVLVGTLAISNGAVVWKPKGKKNDVTMSWETFDEVMRKRRRSKRR